MKKTGVDLISVQRISALVEAKETGRGVPLLISTSRLAQASASSLPWIHSRMVLLARWLSMRPRSEKSAKLLWITLRGVWLSVHMDAASSKGKSCSLSHEVKDAVQRLLLLPPFQRHHEAHPLLSLTTVVIYL